MRPVEAQPAPVLASSAKDDASCRYLILDQSEWRAQDIASLVWPGEQRTACAWSNDASAIALDSPQAVLAHDGVMSMHEVFTALEERPNWTPLIAYAERSTPSRVVDVLRMGAVDFIEWPASADATRDRIQQTLIKARADAFGRQRAYHAKRRLEALSGREREVLDLLSDGGSNKAIARTLNLSPRTVEVHRSNMMKKLNCPTSAAAIRLGLVARLN